MKKKKEKSSSGDLEQSFKKRNKKKIVKETALKSNIENIELSIDTIMMANKSFGTIFAQCMCR